MEDLGGDFPGFPHYVSTGLVRCAIPPGGDTKVRAHMLGSGCWRCVARAFVLAGHVSSLRYGVRFDKPRMY